MDIALCKGQIKIFLTEIFLTIFSFILCSLSHDIGKKIRVNMVVN
jgi:hypothetical protein